MINNVTMRLSREENITYYNKEEITLDIEEYLRGVVATEIGNSPVQACAAQAIVSRNFAMNAMIHNGYITDKSSIDQAFRASRLNGNYPNAYKGVKITKGQLLYYNDAICKCYCCDSNGGIVNRLNKWNTAQIPYLKGGYTDSFDCGSGNTHCVGLSQEGAIARANVGQTYQEILAFYFPNTYIKKEGESSMTENETKIIKWLTSRIGDGYVWAADGYILTEQLLEEKKQQYPDHVTNTCRKWIGKRCWDCASFVKYCMQQVGISMASGATSAWNRTNWERRGTIDEMPQNEICVLYRQTSPTNMQHTGIYLGNGYFVDARGSSAGVVKNKLGSYSWTHWGQPAGLYSHQPQPEPAETAIRIPTNSLEEAQWLAAILKNARSKI